MYWYTLREVIGSHRAQIGGQEAQLLKSRHWADGRSTQHHWKWSHENVFFFFFLNNLRSPPLNLAASIVSHSEFSFTVQALIHRNPLPRYSLLACIHTAHSPFTTHQAFYFSSPNPSFFWFSCGRSEAGLSLRNLISWVNAKKWLCSIRGSAVFRTIAVVQRAGNLANTNTISSACPAVLDRMLKLCDCCSSENPSGEKIQHRVALLQLPLIWQIRAQRITAAPSIHDSRKIRNPKEKRYL